MPANGLGVVLDNAVPPLRLAYSDGFNVDAQNDQVEILTTGRYDYSKIWSCMGTAGINGVVRTGLVEEGDPFNGWQAGSIVPVVAGAPVGEFWTPGAAPVAYNPLGGLGAGDYCMFSVIDSWEEGLLHLAAGIAAPTVAYEYWNGAAWVAATMLITPDWTCATTLNQRFKIRKPSNWAESTPAQIGLPALAAINPGSYYRFRIFLVAPIGVAPAANTGYKDHFKGHWRRFFMAYDLKRGDDTAAAVPTNFLDDGNFSLKFRDGRGLDGRTGIGGDYADHGSVDTQTTRHTLGKAWNIVAPGKRLTLWGGRFSNGFIATIPRHRDVTTTGDFLIRGNLLDVNMYNVMLNGYAGSSASTLGAAGATAVEDLVNVRVTPHPLFADSSVSTGIIQTFNVEAAALVDKLIIDVLRRTGGVKWVHGIRSSVAGALFEGIMFTDDDFVGGPTSAQIVSTGGGVALFRNVDWGGPSLKVYAISGREFRRLTFQVRDNGSSSPLNGIPIRVTASDGVVQTSSELTDINGRLDTWSSADWTGVFSGSQNQAIAKVSKWAADVETPTDEYMRIEVNPQDLAGYNSLFQSLDFNHRFPRRLIYDFALAQFVLADWQRADVEMFVALPRVTVPPDPTPDPYVPQYPPVVPYTGTAPAEVPYVPDPPADVEYVPDGPPDPNFTPCDPLPADVYGLCDVPPVTVYARLSVPEIDYIECGTTRPGKVILLVPGMVMRLSGS
jgi:hypothetical protein